MNGFAIFSESYKELLSQGLISREEAEKKCKVYDFLTTCDDEDICNLFDSSAFNDIAKSYLRRAVKELVDEGTIDEEQGIAVRNRFRLLFDEKRAKEVCEGVSYVQPQRTKEQINKEKEDEEEI